MEELLAKYFSSEASQEEKAKVEQWRGESEENAKSFLNYKTVWIETNKKFDVNENILHSIVGDEQQPQSIKVLPLWQQRSFQLAASVIVIMGLVFYLVQSGPADQPYDQVLSQKTNFELPDGSEVTVQKGGSLSLGDFETMREVTITGKAYFDVERDENKEFIIHTSGADVKVLGTSFVVNTNAENLTTEVLVESGLVAFTQNEKYFGKRGMEIQLEKGEMGIIVVGERGIKKRKISDVNYLAWQNEVLTFNKSRMSDVSNVLEDVYGLDVAFENPALQGCYLTAKYNRKPAEEVVDLIAKTFNMTYEIEADVVTFNGEGCQ